MPSDVAFANLNHDCIVKIATYLNVRDRKALKDTCSLARRCVDRAPFTFGNKLLIWFQDNPDRCANLKFGDFSRKIRFPIDLVQPPQFFPVSRSAVFSPEQIAVTQYLLNQFLLEYGRFVEIVAVGAFDDYDAYYSRIDYRAVIAPWFLELIVNRCKSLNSLLLFNSKLYNDGFQRMCMADYRRLKRLCLHDVTIAEEVCNDPFAFQQIINAAPNFCSGLNTLSLNDVPRSMMNAVLRRLIDGNNTLTSLSVMPRGSASYLTSEGAIEVFSNLVQLPSLVTKHFQLRIPAFWLKQVLLSEVEPHTIISQLLSANGFDTLELSLPHQTVALIDELVAPALNRLTYLKAFSLYCEGSDVSAMTRRICEVLGKLGLESLYLQATSIELYFASDFIFLTNLTKLTLLDCKIIDRTLIILSHQCPNVQICVVKKCQKISSYGIKALVQHMDQLRQLEISQNGPRGVKPIIFEEICARMARRPDVPFEYFGAKLTKIAPVSDALSSRLKMYFAEVDIKANECCLLINKQSSAPNHQTNNDDDVILTEPIKKPNLNREMGVCHHCNQDIEGYIYMPR